MSSWQVIEADCIEALRGMDEASVDAIVTDPPYGLHFMGKTWDQFGGPTGRDNTTHNERGGAMHAGKYDLRLAGMHGFQAEAERWGVAMLWVLKPGGHLLIFGGTRTYHRLACGLEDAGFEIRDCLAWLYGSGFPKSLDVSKAIDKAAGVEREAVGVRPDKGRVATFGGGPTEPTLDSLPATPEAEQWQGWGTALKPAYEPIVLARKPLVGTVAANVLAHGTGALNIDGTRIEGPPSGLKPYTRTTENQIYNGTQSKPDTMMGVGAEVTFTDHPAGRWPANVLLDEQAAGMLDEQSGERPPGIAYNSHGFRSQYVGGEDRDVEPFAPAGYADKGGASRFFYTAKASSAERNRGLEHMAERAVPDNAVSRAGQDNEHARRPNRAAVANHHPTVKPVDLMQWLCRLITPPGGLILDPFTGSGSTGIAALREGFDFVGIEREPEYVEIARDRIIGDAPLFNVASEVAPIRIRSEGDE